jgi:hypothetical protein
MIKFIITATALLVSMLSNSQDNGKATQGEFNGKLCDIGRGLCTTTPPKEYNKSTKMKNYTAYRQDYNVVMFELDTKTLNAEDQIKFFGKEYAKITATETLEFIQDEDFIFDMDTMIYLDLDLGWRLLKKGSYPIKIINDKVQVFFTLSQYR